MVRPRIMLIPYPAQGHVIPFMEFGQRLATNGFRVTLVNTEFNHDRVVKAFPGTGKVNEHIDMVSIPDGCESNEERNDHGKLAQAIQRVMPGKLETLIKMMNGAESDEIACVIGDFYMGWAMEVAEKLEIKRAVFSTASLANVATTISTRKLVDDEIIDNDGEPLKSQLIQLAPFMPKVNVTNLSWCLPDSDMSRIIFHCIQQNSIFTMLAQKIICNTSTELENGALDFLPDCIPIGPLLSSSRLGKSLGHFWPEDSTCIDWLDRQSPNSVVYIAFGSFTIFNEAQFHELAVGLESTNRPFLWVVRQDMVQDMDHCYPQGFKERVKDRAIMVGWAPQQQVLSHPSVGCFVSHCGWNSTLEGVSYGVPFLTWPYFADQFIGQSYICNHWEVGLALDIDESGIIRNEEIKSKVEQLMGNDGYRMRSMELKHKIMAGIEQGGSSRKNFDKFIDWIKENAKK